MNELAPLPPDLDAPCGCSFRCVREGQAVIVQLRPCTLSCETFCFALGQLRVLGIDLRDQIS